MEYSAQDCLKIMKEPSPLLRTATNWLRARMSGATVAQSVKDWIAQQEELARDANTAQATEGAELQTVLNYFLSKGEHRLTVYKAKNCKLRQGTPASRLQLLDEACAKSPN